ncbi:MAG: formylmethanofuran dehydrogenase subunit E family protein [bacterium]|nr:formylmethanofuran dehydrogenase subunit E family protein [bacterium]
MLIYEETIRFHGHDGPFLAIGYQAGLYAVNILNPEGIMDIECKITVVPQKPFTCIIDGIQSSSCCTIGKGNLIVEKSTSNPPIIQFDNRKNGKSVRLKVKQDIFELAIKSENLIKDATLLCKMQPEELFELCMNGH